MTSAILTHWTCEHGAAGIRRSGVVIPHPQPVLDDIELSWWTDLEGSGDLVRAALGLTSTILSCDRLTVCFQAIEPDLIQPWTTFARAHAFQRRWALQGAEGVLPRHWLVSTQPVPVVERPH